MEPMKRVLIVAALAGRLDALLFAFCSFAFLNVRMPDSSMELIIAGRTSAGQPDAALVQKAV
jgi:hypothetical protein